MTKPIGTSKPGPSRDVAHFERLYAANSDPWAFATSPYEQEKYRATIGALDRRIFARGVEIGCSIGVLTSMLAAQCNALIAVDPVEAALVQARARCAALHHVAFQRMQVPQALPGGQFDLMVFSEVLYFLAPSDLAKLVTWAVSALMPGGVALLVNYTGRAGESASGDPLTGDEAADGFIALAGSALRVAQHQRAPAYRIDRLHRIS